MRYFLDNCISFKFAAMLRAIEVHVVALRDEFPQGISDVDLLGELKGRDLVFVSLDRRQLTRVVEASQLKAAGVSAVYFGSFFSDLGFWKQAEWIVTRWQRIDSTIGGLVRGSIIEVKQNGKGFSVPA